MNGSAHILTMLCTQTIAIVLGLANGGCAGTPGDTGAQRPDGWLAGCVSDAGCSVGLSCIANLCTLACTLDEQCEVLGEGACLDVGAPDTRACAVAERLACSAAATSCTADVEGWLCVTGVQNGCTRPAELCSDGAWVPGTIDECRDTITRGAPPGAAETFETVVGDAKVALDIVFVVDNSASMTDEQRGVAIAFDDFLQALAARVDALPRVAATSVDASCDVGPSVSSAKGSFNVSTTRSSPPTAQFRFMARCSDDAQCEAAACDQLGQCDDQAGLWHCRTPTIEACIENPNGSLNTTCRRGCTTDDECRTALGDPSYSCQMPSANPGDWGCLRPPATESCPDTLPLFVEGEQLDLARCLMSIRVNQDRCIKYEQGLEASLMALDPNGPNPEQVAAFLRPEAILVVIYLSDEDDCSAGGVIGEDDYESCAFLASTDQGGPLYPTSRYVDFLRDLKPRGRVMAMALTGVSTETDPAAIEAEYAAYVASKSDSMYCFHQTSLCQTSATVADWGRRYAEVASAFGPDGHVENLCAVVDDYSEQLENVAARIAENAKRVCLPYADTADLVVSIVHDGSEIILTRDGTLAEGYTLIEAAAECATGRAVAPARRLASGDRVRLTYP